MRYNPAKIEKKWQAKWLKDKTYEPNFKGAKKPYYNLMMFPYPSAEGLHVGNVYAFTGSDIYGRFQRMRGYDVFEPIGLDGFGIHSENYALKIGKHPAKQAKVSEKNFYRQLRIIGNGFSWDEHLETYDPEYYKWTQWIFVQMFKRGLAYRKKAKVNWCPSCKTVLADEQVINGNCERCETQVIKKDLEQWFFKITDYAERLLKNLETIDWSEKVKIAQKNWIGKSEGAEIGFRIKDSELSIKVFTTRPDTLFGATYMVLAPEHALVTDLKVKIQNWDEVAKYRSAASQKSEIERIAETKEKTGVELKGVKAINPANQEEIPIWISDYVLVSYGTGAIMAVPAHDERDREFARKYKLPARVVIMREVHSITPDKISEGKLQPDWSTLTERQRESERQFIKEIEEYKYTYLGEGVLINSGEFNGIESEKTKWEITKFVGGERKVQYRLRDWLISRQRYWGPPIPMIYCPACAKASAGKENAGWQPVPENDLPVKLPFVKDFQPKGKGESPLASVKSFYETKCPKCGRVARRETDVSDTFLDSAWYFLRYPSVKDKKYPWNPATTKRWLPVQMYIGGAEHSVLHLLYSRFLTMVFKDWGLLDFEEPFVVFRAHGLIIKDGAKMSKSRGNIVNPDDYVRAYGADALRLYLMFTGPFQEGGDFRDSGIAGMTRFLNRVWKFLGATSDKGQGTSSNDKTKRAVHRAVKKVTEDISELHYNTAISALMILLNEFEASPGSVSDEDVRIFLKLLAPFAPHITEELWQMQKGEGSIHKSSWPRHDEKLLTEATFELVVQINGKARARLTMPVGASQKEAESAVQADAAAAKFLMSEPQKVVFVPNRLINFVL